MTLHAGVALLALALYFSAPAIAQERSVLITRNLEIPVGENAKLRGDLYQPAVDGVPLQSLPTIVTYFPYVKDDASRFEVTAMHRFAEAGYAGLLVDLAGSGVSPGEFGFLNQREIADGRDVVEWAAQQTFSNGRVGLWGYSYPGITAALIAATRPPHLEAVVPASIYHDTYRDLVYPGGILFTQDVVLLPWVLAQSYARQRQGTDPQLAYEALLGSIFSPGGTAVIAEAALHQTYDAYWQERALENKIGQIEVPTLFWGGWADIYPRGTLLNYHDVGAQHKRLVMGPWGHLAGASDQPLELFLTESLAWFDTFLRKEATAEEAEAIAGVARLFQLDPAGEETYADVWSGRFVEHRGWPAGSARTTLEICTATPTIDASTPWPIQGALGGDCDVAGAIPVANLPVDPTGGGSIGHDAYAHALANLLWDDKDQRLSLGSTVLLTEPAAEDLWILGSSTVKLTAMTAGVDADWVVRLVDVGPDGAFPISPGWLRAAARRTDPARPYVWHTHDGPELLTPLVPYSLEVEIWPTSYRLPAGHRLGLAVRSADTLKVAPGIGSAASQILTGNGASTLELVLPEPSGTLLLGAGVLTLAGLRRFGRRS